MRSLIRGLKSPSLLIPILTGGIGGYLNFLYAVTPSSGKVFLSPPNMLTLLTISLLSYILLSSVIMALATLILRFVRGAEGVKSQGISLCLILFFMAVMVFTAYWFEVPKAAAVETGLFKLRGSLSFYPLFCILIPFFIMIPLYFLYLLFGPVKFALAFGVSFVVIPTVNSLDIFEKRGGEDLAPGLPNILLITLDTLRYDFTGLYEGSGVMTPSLEKFAERGVIFEQAIAPIPATGPSHLSILTSTYPSEHGAWLNGAPLSGSGTMLQTILKRLGYRTYAFVSSFVLDGRFGMERDFDIYDDSFYAIKGVSSILPARLMEIAKRFQEPDIVVERVAERVTDDVIAFMERRGGEEAPFFLWVHYFDPHGPYTPPPPYDSLYYEGDPRNAETPTMVPPEDLPSYMREGLKGVKDIEYPVAMYRGEITYMDYHMGRLLDYFEREGLISKTLAVITSDHGESLTEHDYYFNHGAHLFDPDIRVPLVIRFDGRFESAGRVSEQVEITDIAPTILDALHIRRPETMKGRSLLPLIEGARGEWKEEAFSMCLDREENLKVGRSLYRMFAIRTPLSKFIFRESAPPALFDLGTDSGELTNLASERGEEVEFLTRRAVAMLKGKREDYDVSMDREVLEKLKALGYVE